ncbi:hypothetical protein BKP37_12665 [Anaerobacillus alkalilacustris]|uniref:Uncharacterized protein n=1 Tax=Anaerobacillus alkalilacustris TaxID=393763 RepID=A0A1S2LKD2_9BACI|nr:hypothetical protein [Anaerobacillus alkalilacustris]OIJ12650.1 hypothetical protein BKP37_12665 [Anaerobacillus alkalilacustris]
MFEFLFEVIITAIITAVIIVPVGFFMYYSIYYKVTNRDKIKQQVLSYLENANVAFDTTDKSYHRLIINDKNKAFEVENLPVYPSAKAIMDYMLQTEVIQRGVKYGFKYDETFFKLILGDLMMEGRVTAIRDESTDEMIGYKFLSHQI